MDISDKERGILQRIVTDDAFEIMQRVASPLLQNWNKGPMKQETEWLTAAEAVSRDERKMALTSFLETLEKLSNEK